jgi:hypothetical protein
LGRSPGLRLAAALVAASALATLALAWQPLDRASRHGGRQTVPYFGFNEASWGTAWQGQALEDAVLAAAGAGANTNKLTVRWFDVVAPLGAPDEDGWARYRHAYQTMIDAGIRPVISLVGAPRGVDQAGDPVWATPGCTAAAASPPAPEYDQQWKEFVARAGLEFGDALAFQVWNEPNSDEYWGGCDVDPARYVRLVDLARQALGPSTRMPIVSAGLNSAVDEPAGMPWATYLQTSLDLGLLTGDRAQFVGVHPYPEPESCAAAGPGAGGAMVDSMDAQLDLAARIAPTNELWVTEFGASSAAGLFGECRALGPAGQAQVVSEMYDRLAAHDRVEVAIVHQLVDQMVTNPDPAAAAYWSNFGLTNAAGPATGFLEPKDAYWCLAGRRGHENHSTVPCRLPETRR